MRPVRTPIVLQMEAAECGAAALAIVAGYYGCHVPLPELRMACAISRDGSRAGNVVRAARQLGMRAEGLCLDLQALETMEAPVILFWEGRHFIVLEGLDRQHAWLNDPAFGRRRITRAAFVRGYAGVVLACRPDAGFVKRRRAGLPDWAGLPLSPVGIRAWPAQGMLLAWACAGHLSLLLLPLLGQLLVDALAGAGRHAWIMPLALLLATAGVLRGGAAWGAWRGQQHLAATAATATGAQLASHLLSLPPWQATRHETDRLAWGLPAGVRAAETVVFASSRIVGDIALLFACLILLPTLDAPLGWPCVVMLALQCAFHAAGLRAQAAAGMQLAQERARLATLTSAALAEADSLQPSLARAEFFQRWGGLQASLANASLRQRWHLWRTAQLPNLLAGAMLCLLLWQGGARLQQGGLSMGLLLALASVLLIGAAALRRIVAQAARLQGARADLVRAADVLALPATLPAHANSGGQEALVPVEAAQIPIILCARNLSFAYGPASPRVIDDLSFTLAAGQCVAVVGEPGCGKSTLCRLLAGLLVPDGGTWSWARGGGASIADSAIAWCSPDAHLFDASVRDNISLWDDTLAEPDIVRAAIDAGIHASILARPGGYGEPVAADGRNFSAGERLRLLLARALVRQPAVLVLDDVLAFFDAESEARLFASLRQRGCACVIVGARPSTLRACDRVLVMAQGRLSACANHACA